MTIETAPGRRVGPTLAFAIDTTLMGRNIYTRWTKNLVFLPIALGLLLGNIFSQLT